MKPGTSEADIGDLDIDESTALTKVRQQFEAYVIGLTPGKIHPSNAG